MKRTKFPWTIFFAICGIIAVMAIALSCQSGKQEVQAGGDANASNQSGIGNVMGPPAPESLQGEMNAAAVLAQARLDIRAKADIDAKTGLVTMERLWSKMQEVSDNSNRKFKDVGTVIESKDTGISDTAFVLSLLGTAFLTALFCRADDIFRGVVSIIHAKRDERRRVIAERLEP